MNLTEVKQLKNKIELYKDVLYTMDLEVEFIYSVFKIFISMRADEAIIDIWLYGLEKEVDAIKEAIKKIESNTTQ